MGIWCEREMGAASTFAYQLCLVTIAVIAELILNNRHGITTMETIHHNRFVGTFQDSVTLVMKKLLTVQYSVFCYFQTLGEIQGSY